MKKPFKPSNEIKRLNPNIIGKMIPQVELTLE